MSGRIVFLCAIFLFFAHGVWGASDDIFSSIEIGYGSGLASNRPMVIASAGLKEAPYVIFHVGGFQYTEESTRKTGFVGGDIVIDGYTLADCPTSWCPMNRLGLGISYFDNPSKNFGSKLEFHTLVKLGMIHESGDFYLLGGIDHWSTGGLTKKNIGETFIGLVAGFLF